MGGSIQLSCLNALTLGHARQFALAVILICIFSDFFKCCIEAGEHHNGAGRGELCIATSFACCTELDRGGCHFGIDHLGCHGALPD